MRVCHVVGRRKKVLSSGLEGEEVGTMQRHSWDSVRAWTSELVSEFGVTVLACLHVKVVSPRSSDLYGGGPHKIPLFPFKLWDLCSAFDVTGYRNTHVTLLKEVPGPCFSDFYETEYRIITYFCHPQGKVYFQALSALLCSWGFGNWKKIMCFCGMGEGIA